MRARARAERLLSIVGLSSVKNNFATETSWGQRQRTAIPRAPMNGPNATLADEPTGDLDRESSDAVHRLFGRINKEVGTSFAIVTHDRRVAEQTDRIVEIRDGRVGLDVGK